MKPYIYNGRARTSFSIPVADGAEPQSIALIPGHITDVPENLPYVQRLIRNELLTPAPKVTTKKAGGAK